MGEVLSIAEHNRKGFKKRLEESHGPVMVIADWLTRVKGKAVTIAPAGAYKGKVRGDGVDHGDLFIQEMFGPISIALRVEVKRRKKLTFTGADSFKFDDVIVCACHSFDRPIIKPKYYVHTNSSMTHALWINVDNTRPYWRRAEVGNNGQYLGSSGAQWCYLCPKELIKFFKLEGA